jgi:hypothetical protein
LREGQIMQVARRDVRHAPLIADDCRALLHTRDVDRAARLWQRAPDEHIAGAAQRHDDHHHGDQHAEQNTPGATPVQTFHHDTTIPSPPPRPICATRPPHATAPG